MLDKGHHETEHLQKECLFLLYYHFPMEDSSESFEDIFKSFMKHRSPVYYDSKVIVWVYACEQ